MRSVRTQGKRKTQRKTTTELKTRRRQRASALLWIALLGLAADPRAGLGRSPDEAGVRRAALDYLEGFYEGDDDKLRRSIHPEVSKFGFARPDPSQAYRRIPMSYEQMFEFAAGVREGRDVPPAGASKEVIPLDVRDQTAVVRVVAWWGQDYLQMAKHDGRWMIVHVLWQSLDGG
jgi:hypothetical protein